MNRIEEFRIVVHVRQPGDRTPPPPLGELWLISNPGEPIAWAFHQCPCGCGSLRGLPVTMDGLNPPPNCWVITVTDPVEYTDRPDLMPTPMRVSLSPSIRDRGNCQSHYYITENRVVWA